jgi:hypothetical protein
MSMKRISLVITILALNLATLATGASKPNSAVPLTSTLAGAGYDPDPTLANYRIQGDLLGDYHDGVDSVVSQMQGGGGDYELSTLGSPTRKLLLDFRDPASTGTTPPFQVQTNPARVVTQTFTRYSSQRPYNMTGLDSTLVSPLVWRFDLPNGDTYRIWMDSVRYPGTNDALITCTGVVDPANLYTSQCNQWKIEPIVTQPIGKNIGRLVRFYTSRGKTIEEPHGDFYMSFSIGTKNP